MLLRRLLRRALVASVCIAHSLMGDLALPKQVHAQLGLQPMPMPDPSPSQLFKQLSAPARKDLGCLIIGRLPSPWQPSAHIVPWLDPAAAAQPAPTAARQLMQLATDMLPDTPLTGLLEADPHLAPEQLPLRFPSRTGTAVLSAIMPPSPSQLPNINGPLLPALLLKHGSGSACQALWQLLEAGSLPAKQGLQLLAGPQDAEHLLAVEFTMQTMPGLLPQPFLPCVDQPSASQFAGQLLHISVQPQSTAHLELYLDWVATSPALDTALDGSAEAVPVPRPPASWEAFLPPAAILAALRPSPASLRAGLVQPQQSRLAVCKTVTAAPPAAGVTANVCESQQGLAAVGPAQASAAAPVAGLGYLAGLCRGRQAAAPAAGKPTGTGMHQAEPEILTAFLPGLHISLLQQLQECDVNFLDTGPGLNQAVK